MIDALLFLITHLIDPLTVGTGVGRQGFEKMISQISLEIYLAYP